jgi:hypothetical protein
MKDPWNVFAHKLFDNEEADPMYYALERADIDVHTRLRFTAAWCTYYHPGVAAVIAEHHDKEFWDVLSGYYPHSPRASERRHFRGNSGLKAIAQWREKFPHPEDMILATWGDTFFKVRERCKGIAQIGQYFVWKLADVQDRVFKYPCDFTGAENYSPKVPQDAAHMIFKEMHPEMVINAKELVPYVYNKIIAELQPRNSPPRYDRRINMQEAETVCCVYHQYLGGGYFYGSRTGKAFRRLSEYPCALSSKLLDALTLGLPYTPPHDEEET